MRWTVICLILVCSVAWSGVPEPRSVRFNQSKHELELRFSRPVHYHTFHLNQPPRFVIDISHIQHPPQWRVKHSPMTRLKRLRTAFRNHRLRLVLDLEPHTAALAHRDDIADSVLKVKLLQRPGAGQFVSPPRPQNIHIVIDPGHGGRDPGARGPRGHTEKEAVLGIARRLKQDINRHAGFKAILTREGDQYLSLRQRLRMTREQRADLFISIHADAFKNRKAQGVSVFALSKHGASSAAAAWLARRENRSEMAGVDISDKGRILSSILLDLSQTAVLGTSVKLGHFMLQQLGRVTDLHSDRIEQAGFMVLKSPDTPSLLLESGFISNPEEEKRLFNRRYQRRMAQAVGRGIYRYFRQHPPQGTKLAMMRMKAVQYRVKPGDTLSGIAKRFHTTQDQIMRINHLIGTRLKPGQNLKLFVQPTSIRQRHDNS